MSVTVTDNTARFLEEYAKAKKRGLQAIGMTAETHAKEIITEAHAVDTGRLRNSITYALGGESANISNYSGDHGEPGGTYTGHAPKDSYESVYIGTNVEYAEGIELGTHRKAGAVHMLKKSATENTKEYEGLLKDSLENA